MKTPSTTAIANMTLLLNKSISRLKKDQQANELKFRIIYIILVINTISLLVLAIKS